MKYVILIALVLSACSLNEKGRTKSAADSAADSAERSAPATGRAAVSNEPEGLTVGVQNFRELYRSWLSLTGINDNQVVGGGVILRAYFNDTAKNILPAKGLVAEASTNVFFTTAVLAANVSRLFITQESAAAAANRKVYTQVNFAGNEQQLKDETLLRDVTEKAFGLFVGRPIMESEFSQMKEGALSCVNNRAGASSSQELINCLMVLTASIMSSVSAISI